MLSTSITSVNDMQCVVFDCCSVCCVDVVVVVVVVVVFFFGGGGGFEHVLRSCTANCGRPSIFMSQMAVGFSNAIRTDVSFGVWSFHHERRGILFFILLSCFKQCVLLSCFKQCVLGLNCSNHFALLLQCNDCLEMFLFFS